MSKKHILVNLKRFDIPNTKGGVCPNASPTDWIKETLSEIIKQNWGACSNLDLKIFVPDALLHAASVEYNKFPPYLLKNVSLGSQSCHFEDVSHGGNFGAFTSHNLAKSQASIGAKTSIIGHCEERNAIKAIIDEYSNAHGVTTDLTMSTRVINGLINRKLLCAFNAGLDVTLCVGETEVERGQGSIESQRANAMGVLKQQLLESLADMKQYLDEKRLVIAYEPVWAIGPGKTLPEADYIEFVGSFIKSVLHEEFGIDAPVVYGGGVKTENVKMLSSIESIDGGLIALTNFAPPIGFYSTVFEKIVRSYLQNKLEVI